jgi:ribonucleoside-diphosphate reductase alpha subunit
MYLIIHTSIMSNTVNKNIILDNINNDTIVIKRNGTNQVFNCNKITRRLERLIDKEPRLLCNAMVIVTKTLSVINVDEISTSDIDGITAKISYDMVNYHPDYAVLSARIVVDNLHKNTDDSFTAFIDKASNNKNTTIINNPHAPLIDSKLYRFVKNNKLQLNKILNCAKDFQFDWFGIWTLIDRYLIKRSGNEDDKLARPQDFVIERPQYMFMRIACALSINQSYVDDNREVVFQLIEDIYNDLSDGRISLATPTMKNAGTTCGQLLSCFLLRMEDDSEKIMKGAMNIALISKGAGGVGWSKCWRPNKTEVKKTSGRSAGEGPFLKIYEKILEAFDQGGNRPGSGADYKRIWEYEFLTWIKYRRPRETEETSIRNLFYAIWKDDLFMDCVRNDLPWYFISKYDQPELVNLYGDAFEKKYFEIVANPLGTRITKMPARKVFNQILETMIESGMPYMASADRVNELSNQKNIGLIHNSNLCIEIMETCSEDRIACCCLATIPVNRFLVLKPEYKEDTDNNFNPDIAATFVSDISDLQSSSSSEDDFSSPKHHTSIGIKQSLEYLLIDKYTYDWEAFKKSVKLTVTILNNVIDVNEYPVEAAKLANMEQRPLGIGIQGMADWHAMTNTVWGSPKSRKFASQVAEVLHFASLEQSKDLAKKHKTFYPYFKANPKFPDIEPCPLAQGIFQWQQWHSVPSGVRRGLVEVVPDKDLAAAGITNWDNLRKEIQEHGIYNSLLNAYPPTASSSNIQGNVESFEPFKSCAYLRKTISGDFSVYNPWLIKLLYKLGLWTRDVSKQMIADDGSIQNINIIPQEVKDLYKTAWEISPYTLADMSACYAPWVDQSMSDNIFIKNASTGVELSNVLMYRDELGLKTVMYYLKQSATGGKRKFANESGNVRQDKAEDISASAISISSSSASDAIEEAVIEDTSSSSSSVAMSCSRDNKDCESCSA